MLRRTWLLTVSGNLSVTDFLSSLWIIKIISDDLIACALFKARKCEYKIRTKVTFGFDKLFVSKKLHLSKKSKPFPTLKCAYLYIGKEITCTVFYYEGRYWTKCSTRCFVMALRRFVVAFRRFGTPRLLVDSLFSEVDSANCQFNSSSYKFGISVCRFVVSSFRYGISSF